SWPKVVIPASPDGPARPGRATTATAAATLNPTPRRPSSTVSNIRTERRATANRPTRPPPPGVYSSSSTPTAEAETFRLDPASPPGEPGRGVAGGRRAYTRPRHLPRQPIRKEKEPKEDNLANLEGGRKAAQADPSTTRDDRARNLSQDQRPTR